MQLGQEPSCVLRTRRLGQLGLGFPTQAPSMKTGPFSLHRVDFRKAWLQESKREMKISDTDVPTV